MGVFPLIPMGFGPSLLVPVIFQAAGQGIATYLEGAVGTRGLMAICHRWLPSAPFPTRVRFRDPQNSGTYCLFFDGGFCI